MSDEVHSPWDALDTMGNIAAWVRENCGDATNQTQKYMDDIIMFVKAALALPRRNCDVGTAVEQERRWSANCGEGIPNCKHCKVYEEAKNSGLVNGRYLMRCDCRFIWAQMPYEAKEGGSDGNRHQ